MRRLNEGSSKAEKLWISGISNGTYEHREVVTLPSGKLTLKLLGRAGMDPNRGVINEAWCISGYMNVNDSQFVEVECYYDSRRDAEDQIKKIKSFNFEDNTSYLIKDEDTSNWVFKG